jgi:hypothetical protein
VHFVWLRRELIEHAWAASKLPTDFLRLHDVTVIPLTRQNYLDIAYATATLAPSKGLG